MLFYLTHSIHWHGAILQFNILWRCVMKVTVFGTKTWEMRDERTGEIRRGITAHCTSDSLNANVRGLEYSKFKIKTTVSTVVL